jgi:hypothetical protein
MPNTMILPLSDRCTVPDDSEGLFSCRRFQSHFIHGEHPQEFQDVADLQFVADFLFFPSTVGVSIKKKAHRSVGFRPVLI